MSRTAWSLPIIAVLGLTLVSCFDDVSDCPTCPATNSGVIKISVPQNALVDSVEVRVDGGPQVMVKRKAEYRFTGLGAGTHVVDTRRWYTELGLPKSRAQTFQLELARGETRTIVFHNDFPLISWLQAEPHGRCPGVPGA